MVRIPAVCAARIPFAESSTVSLRKPRLPATVGVGFEPTKRLRAQRLRAQRFRDRPGTLLTGLA
jgi:hypothetical protein